MRLRQRLYDWWDSHAWRPASEVSAAKDRKIERLRADAIKARMAHEQSAVVIETQLSSMRRSLNAIDQYRAAERKRR
jgi:hypothetical protein